MITYFCDFRQFSAKEFAFFSKTNVMIKFLQKIAVVLAKNANCFAKKLTKIYLNHNNGPPGRNQSAVDCSAKGTDLSKMLRFMDIMTDDMYQKLMEKNYNSSSIESALESYLQAGQPSEREFLQLLIIQGKNNISKVRGTSQTLCEVASVSAFGT
jgi:hypothetical protein